MKMTSAEANKLLRKLRDEHETLTDMEYENRTFTAATVEKEEDARPDYDYEETQRRLEALEQKILCLKHAINLFNVAQEVPGTGMTIDQALVRIPQLTDRKRKLGNMRSVPRKKRNTQSRGTNLIEYTYANYDPAKVDEDYQAVSDELARLQNALDLVNSTVSFDVDIAE